MLTHVQGARLLTGMKSVRFVARSKRPAQIQITFMEYLPEFQSVAYEARVRADYPLWRQTTSTLTSETWTG